jgi:hypothetical protein
MQKVHVEFDGWLSEAGAGWAARMPTPSLWHEAVVNGDSYIHLIYRPGTSSGVTFVKDPPKVGELWEDDKGTHFFIKKHAYREEVVAMGENGETLYQSDSQFSNLVKRLYPPEK